MTADDRIRRMDLADRLVDSSRKIQILRYEHPSDLAATIEKSFSSEALAAAAEIRAMVEEIDAFEDHAAKVISESAMRAENQRLMEHCNELKSILHKAGALESETPESFLSRLAARDAEIERLREALTPSADTKRAYIGEFSFTFPGAGNFVVPWFTVKEIMRAIAARAGLANEDIDARQARAALTKEQGDE